MQGPPPPRPGMPPAPGGFAPPRPGMPPHNQQQ
jgi:small nuclear ribonucleoprotein B and B'